MTEPLTVAEVCAYLRIDSTQQEPAPGAITAEATAGSPNTPGNVDNGAHRYLATFVTAGGETQAGTVSAAVTVVDKAVNGQVLLTDIPIGGTLVTARKLYRTAAGGSTYLLLATIANNTATTYTDNIADTSLGVGAPSTNTTGDPLISMMIASARQQAELQLGRFLITQSRTMYFDSFPVDCVWRHGAYFAYPMIRRVGFYGLSYMVSLPPLQSITSIGYIDPAFPYSVSARGIVAPDNSDGADGDVYWNTVTDDIYVKGGSPTEWGSPVQKMYTTLAATEYFLDSVSTPARVMPSYGVTWPAVRAQGNAVKVTFVAGYGTAADVPACIKHWMLLKISAAMEERSPIITGTFVQHPERSYVDGLLDSERVYRGAFG